MQADGAHDLFCSLLEVICRKHIRWIRKQAGRCIEIEKSRGIFSALGDILRAREPLHRRH